MAARLVWPGKAEALSLAEQTPTPKAKAQDGSGVLPDELCLNSHHIFVGDNIKTLRYLHASPMRFHFIYIDPPYNSGQQFSYLDKHGASSNEELAEEAWLSMMTPRLVLAQRILHETGIIFVSIDDREVGALSLLMREIFGRENHVGTLKWKKKRKPSFLDKHLGVTMEYLLVFAKNAKQLPKLLGDNASDSTRPVLNASNQVAERVLLSGTEARCKDGQYRFGVRRNKTLDVEFLDSFEVKNHKLLHDVRVRGRFRVAQDLLARTVFITTKLGLRRRVMPDELSRKHASDVYTDWPTNEDAERELRSLFGERVFDYPKPVGLIRNLLKMYQHPKETPIFCLDFFAGSASFAEAVLQQNADDRVPRAFVVAQSPEKNEAGGRFSTIADLTIERTQRAIAQHGSTLPLEIISI